MVDIVYYTVPSLLSIEYLLPLQTCSPFARVFSDDLNASAASPKYLRRSLPSTSR